MKRLSAARELRLGQLEQLVEHEMRIAGLNPRRKEDVEKFWQMKLQPPEEGED